RIDTDAKVVQTLCDASAPRGGTWGSDGTILFAPIRDSTIYQIPANGGAPTPATELNTSRGEFSHRWPVFLADGKHILFFVPSDQEPESSGIYAGSLGSKDRHAVVRTAVGPAFVAGGAILYMRGEAIMAQPFDKRKLATVGEPVPLPDRVRLNPMISGALF